MLAREVPDTVDKIENCLRSASQKVASALLTEDDPEVVWIHGNLKKEGCDVSVYSMPARVGEHRGKPGCWVIQHTQYIPDDYSSVDELAQELKEGNLAHELAEEAWLPGGLPAGWIELK
jgi:hypothetical protein